jgi:hypothetical protein
MGYLTRSPENLVEVLQSMLDHGGVITHVARKVHISASTIHRWLNESEIEAVMEAEQLYVVEWAGATKRFHEHLRDIARMVRVDLSKYFVAEEEHHAALAARAAQVAAGPKPPTITGNEDAPSAERVRSPSPRVAEYLRQEEAKQKSADEISDEDLGLVEPRADGLSAADIAKFGEPDYTSTDRYHKENRPLSGRDKAIADILARIERQGGARDADRQALAILQRPAINSPRGSALALKHPRGLPLSREAREDNKLGVGTVASGGFRTV